MDGNIYKNARRSAGLTQERWAEALGLAVDSVRRYENGERLPDDETVKTMAELSGLSPLAYWHLCRKSAIAAAQLPPVERLPLPEAVIRLLLAVKELEPDIDMLLEIARDGAVAPEERDDFAMILGDIEKLLSAALCVKFAEGAQQGNEN